MTTRQQSAVPGIDHDTLRCIVDEAGILVFVSPALGWALGREAAELQGAAASSVLGVACQDRALPDIDSGFYDVALQRKGRDPLLARARIDRVDAPGGRLFTVVWLDPDGALQRRGDDAAGDARAFAALVNDNRTANPAAPPAPGSGLGPFMDLTSDLLAIYGRDMAFDHVNPAFCRILGFSEAELAPVTFVALVHPADRERVTALVRGAVDAPPGSDAARAEFECRTLCKDGKFRRIAWVHKAEGRSVYAVGRDVTEARAREEELKRREEQLSEAQKIARMGHWYWEVREGGAGETMEWSEQIYTIFGVRRDAFSPTIGNIVELIFKRDVRHLMSAFQRARIKKKDYEVKFRIRRPGGSVRHIHCEGRCKINPDTGAVEALFGIMQDITERTLHERALRAAKESAESAYASKTRFLANMSHELRTPLNAIIGFSEMMMQQLLGPVGNARYLDYIAGIRESGEHLLDLINDILDMSKIEVGKYELHVETLNVGKTIRLALHMIEGRAHEAEIRLVTDRIPDDVHIAADRRALMQILLNILSNAVKFTPAGGTIEIACQRELGGVAIAVTDTGVGIPREKLDVVTAPFEQVSGAHTRGHKGSGLGLAITKDLVELHGGRLDLDSEMGVGTTVTVLLPEKVAEAHNVRLVEGMEAAG